MIVPDLANLVVDFKENDSLFCGASSATVSVFGTFTSAATSSRKPRTIAGLESGTESEDQKDDPGLQSFLFIFTNPGNVPAPMFHEQIYDILYRYGI
jgi:hypothetical protein